MFLQLALLLIAVYFHPLFSLSNQEIKERFLASRKNVTETIEVKEKLVKIFGKNVKNEPTTTPSVSIAGIFSSPLKLLDTTNNGASPTSNPSILAINAPIAEYMYQGDILLGSKQVESLEKSVGHQNNPSVRSKRQIFIGENAEAYKWSTQEPITYYFDASVEDPLRDKIRKGFQFWQDHTCLSFQESIQGSARVKVYRGEGCFSNVGKTEDPSQQEISIGYGCEIFGTITHEIAHTLDMEHLQNRPDRDGYVTVDESKLSDVWQLAYAKMLPLTQESYGAPYEYGSVMHYGGDSPVTGTMSANDRTFQRTMGNRIKPTFMDIRYINRHYNCESLCNTSSITCHYGGIKNPRNCSECLCPGGFGGPICSSRAQSIFGATCGATLPATAEDQYLNGIIGDVFVEDYFDKGPECHWHIESPENTKIEIQLLSITASCSGTCWEGFVEIKWENFTVTGARFCCDSDVNNVTLATKISEENKVVISLYTAWRQVRFTMKYRIASNSSLQASMIVSPTFIAPFTAPTNPNTNFKPSENIPSTNMPIEMAILPESNLSKSHFSSTKSTTNQENNINSTDVTFHQDKIIQISRFMPEISTTPAMLPGRLMQSTSCPLGWVYFEASRKCYKLVYNVTFDEANILCKVNLNGCGQLASIHGFEENNFLTSWTRAQLIGFPQTSLFIGLQRNSTNASIFTWTDGTSLDYTNWCRNYPDLCPISTNSRQYALVSQYGVACLNLAANNDKIEQNSWVECQRNFENNAVCQTGIVVETPLGNCPSGWTYFSKTKKCYKTIYNVTAQEAIAQCSLPIDSGISGLASIHSDEENSFIAGLSSLQSSTDICWIYLGLKLNSSPNLANNTHIWMDNTPTNYTNFCTRASNLWCQFNMPSRQYMALYTKGSCYSRKDGINPLEWINVLGSEKQSAACQIVIK